jgi:diacylglycerol kinase family enzyme
MSKGKKRILFIVNPISGGIPKKNFPRLVERNLNHQHFDSEVIYWHGDMDAGEMARKGIEEGFDTIAAVGGDGTINKVGAALMGTSVQLAIIPMGSGNGLARHLGIPLGTSSALATLDKMKPAALDAGAMNGHTFINVAGMGFDAHIGDLFDKSTRRGFFTYAGITTRELWSYKPSEYRLMWPGGGLQAKAFFISVCNGSQWGNNARVARGASVKDGLLRVVISFPFKAGQVPGLAGKIFLGGMEKDKAFYIVDVPSLKVFREKAGPVHFDGEPDEAGEVLEFSVKKGALKVLVPSDGGI